MASNKNVKDIKKLMQEKLKTKTEIKVDSPFAKYNSRGQLSCIVCGESVKSSIVWQAHILKKSHKTNLQKLKEKQLQLHNVPIKEENGTTDGNSVAVGTKRIREKPKGILKSKSSYESSSENDRKRVIKTEGPQPPKKKIKIELPGEVVDDKAEKETPMDVDEAEPVEDDSELPEGFFDDPIADAKARNVEYIDKDEEEWSAFVREVSMADKESQQLINDDKQESAIETQLEQNDVQMRYLQRVLDMDDLIKKVKLEAAPQRPIKIESDESSDEEFSPCNWRNKHSFI